MTDLQKPSEKRASVLSFSGFRNLWVGQLVSQFGDTLHMLVFLWLVLDITGNAAFVGTVGAFEMLPYVLFSIYAGVLVDKTDRRRVLLASDVLSAALVLGFVGVLLIQPKPALWVICTFAFLLGSVNVFAAPARSAATPSLVPADRLLDANALNSSAQNSMPLIGNLLSALVLKTIFLLSARLAYVITFAFNALTFVISAFFMAKLPKLEPERSDAPKSAWKDAKEGMKFLVTHPVLAPATMVSMLLSFFVAPFMTTLVVITKERFSDSPAMLPLLESGFFVGMVLGSVLVMRLRIRRVGLAFSTSLFVAGLTILPMGWVYSPWIFWGLNLLCGIVIPFAALPMNTLIQSGTPDALRGRVNSAIAMGNALITPAGMAISGVLIAKLKLEGTFLFMGFGLALCPMVALPFKGYREATLDEAKENAATE